MADMLIRSITAADDAPIAAIVRESLVAYGLDIPGTAYFDPELDHLSSFYNIGDGLGDAADDTGADTAEARAYFVAIDDDGMLVGGAGFAAFPDHPGVAELQKLYVSPAAQHQGLGHRLVAFVERHVAETGYTTIYLETHHNLADAIRLYKQLGYTQLDAPLPGTAHTTMDRFFAKRLPSATDDKTPAEYQRPSSDQNTRLLALAERLARERHAGQVDKGGEDYWHHPQRVSAGCLTDQAKIAGWLHDLLEDTDTTADELLDLGFPQTIVRAADLDTRRGGEPYMDCIRRIRAACDSADPATAEAGRIAREVKLSDLTDNMDLGRLPTVTDRDLRRVERYREAQRMLEDE